MKSLLKISICFFSILFAFGLSSCKEEILVDKLEIAPPVLQDFNPKNGEIGTEITITGENLHRVESVLLGEGIAELKYKINSSKIIAVVTSASRSGKITVVNPKGSSASEENFTVNFVTPSVNDYPLDGIVYTDIVMEGTNLHVVDSLLIGGEKATIISKRKNEIVFRVPFLESEDPVTLRLHYFNGEENTTVGPEGDTFVVLKEAPLALTVPESLEKYTPVSITGERLLLIDSLFVNDIKMLIKSKTDTEIVFDLPTNYFEGAGSGMLKGIYYGVREIILNDNFTINSDPNEPRFFRHENILLSARIEPNSNGTEDAFFDAESGMVFHSCLAYDNRLDIDFFVYDQMNYVQLYGPHNATNVVKNFKCENKSIDSPETLWTDFYGSKGVTTKFKILSKDSVSHLSLINAYEAGTITEITEDLFEGILLPGTSAPRVYKSTTDAGFDASQHMAVNGNNLAWVRNYTTGKDGIIEILDLPKEAHTNGRIADIKFNIIWAK